jgi:FAD binding domain/Berberine and berberine like
MHTTLDLSNLRSRLQGEAFAPGDQDWDTARRAWNLTVDQHPLAVAYAANAEDMSAVVGFAREQSLRVAPQGPGHAAAAMGPLDDAILLKTTRMTGLEIDPDARTARVEAGVLSGDVAVRAGEHGLAAVAGSSPDVSIVGYTLGGGVGWLGRRHGLAANSVLAIELVTADGRLVRVDGDNEPDLFWALRGGGGAFGAVTAMEFRLYPAAELFGGTIAWPAENGSEVLDTYRVWAAALPEEFATSIRFLHLPPFPHVPEPLRDRSVIAVDGAYLGSEAEGVELLRPLRETPAALVDSFATIPGSELRHLHGDPEQPVPGLGDHLMIRELSADAAEAFVAVGGHGSGSPLLSLELRQLGGALAAPPADHGALGALEGEYALYGVGALMDPAAAGAITGHLQTVVAAMEPFSTGRTYLGFDDARPSDTARSFDADTYRRLTEVKARYDGDDVFRSNHPIPPRA